MLVIKVPKILLKQSVITKAKRSSTMIGIPQETVISSLIADIYFHFFIIRFNCKYYPKPLRICILSITTDLSNDTYGCVTAYTEQTALFSI
ncbi:MAG: hypothetical protein LBD41_07070 [Clostridiales Family XIII bacterium]|jgi:hypothetical protein|nr:hypothetical protein [Clostridiales Family XIII bacterium]